MNKPVRVLLDPDMGERYQVRLTPRELTGHRGINRLLNSVVFEAETGASLGAVPVSPTVTIRDFSEADLMKMLERAKRRGL